MSLPFLQLYEIIAGIFSPASYVLSDWVTRESGSREPALHADLSSRSLFGHFKCIDNLNFEILELLTRVSRIGATLVHDAYQLAHGVSDSSHLIPLQFAIKQIEIDILRPLNAFNLFKLSEFLSVKLQYWILNGPTISLRFRILRASKKPLHVLSPRRHAERVSRVDITKHERN